MDGNTTGKTRRKALQDSLAGEDTPVDLTPSSGLPRRTPGEHYVPPVQRHVETIGDADVEFFLCDGGFTQFLETAERITAAKAAAGASRRGELAP